MTVGRTAAGHDAVRPTGHDVVVLSGGVAGCVLACRLSEDPGRSVCLVEAGPDYGPDRSAWPAEVRDARALTRADVWERDVPVHRYRARVLGGSSCVNGCWNTWPSAPDLAAWRAAGGPGWREAELNRHREAAVGRMRLRRVPDHEISPWGRGFLTASAALGYEEVDMGRTGGPGRGSPLVNALDGLRWNAAFAYLDAETRSRPNLTILADATVDRLTVGDGGRIRSAELVRHGRRHSLTAGTYVLAAGTFGSPAVLLRSGIGPADRLHRLGIRPRVDLPGVGANLVDQPAVFVPMAPKPGLDAALAASEAVGGLYVNRALVRAASAYCADGSWDLHLVPSAGPPLFGRLPPGRYEAGFSVLAMKPASRGHVRLRSADPTDAPDIDPGFLTDPAGRDAAVLREGLGLVEQLLASPALKDLADPVPGRSARELAARETRELRDLLGTYWHPVGTCAMGPPDDADAVVDGEGRVRGTANLRVADASILPTVPASNSQLPVITVAELLATTFQD
ncbi:GMC family oxidoreductase [Streptomyces sp. NPDC004779]